jgi:hypothetical protein
MEDQLARLIHYFMFGSPRTPHPSLKNGLLILARLPRFGHRLLFLPILTREAQQLTSAVA